MPIPEPQHQPVSAKIPNEEFQGRPKGFTAASAASIILRVALFAASAAGVLMFMAWAPTAHISLDGGLAILGGVVLLAQIYFHFEEKVRENREGTRPRDGSTAAESRKGTGTP